METDSRCMGDLQVGLELDLVGIEELDGGRLEVTVRSPGPRPVCEGVVQGRPAGGVGGLAGVGSSGAVVVAETPLDVPRPKVQGGVVCGAGLFCGAPAGTVDVSRWAVGNSSGGWPGPHRF